MLSRTSTLLLRHMKNYVPKRYEHGDHDGGIPGKNLPFGKSLGRPGKLTALFMLYFGSAFWAPQFIFIYMYLK